MQPGAHIRKIEILRRWDTRELEVAEDENMISNSYQPDILDQIFHCLHALGAGRGAARSAPTKHGSG